MTIDETFDIGVDTRTGVDDSYTLPFRFTGTIDKLTFKLGPSQLARRTRGPRRKHTPTLTTNETPHLFARQVAGMVACLALEAQ